MPQSNIVKDQEAKGINLENYKTEDCLIELSSQPGNEKIIHALITQKFKLDTIVDIHGKVIDIKIESPAELKYIDIENTNSNMLSNVKMTTKYWSPINYAVYTNQLLYVKYYLEQF